MSPDLNQEKESQAPEVLKRTQWTSFFESFLPEKSTSVLAHISKMAPNSMATILRSGKSWQALIRTKNYLGQKAKAFPSKAPDKFWANAVKRSLKIST